MGYHRKTHAVLLCKSIVISIQWFQMPHIITFSTIYNLAVLFSGARVSQNLSLVPQLYVCLYVYMYVYMFISLYVCLYVTTMFICMAG